MEARRGGPGGGAQAFCDEWGRPLRGDEVADMLEENLELDRLMRLFFHHRHIMRYPLPSPSPAVLVPQEGP